MRVSGFATGLVAVVLSLGSPASAGSSPLDPLWPFSALRVHYKRAAMRSMIFHLQRECRFRHNTVENCDMLASCVLDKMVDSESRFVELNSFFVSTEWAKAPASERAMPPDDPRRYFVPLRMVIRPSAFTNKFHANEKEHQEKFAAFNAERNEYMTFIYQCSELSTVDIRAFVKPAGR